MSKARKTAYTRRDFLKTGAAATAGALTLWLPRGARSAVTGPVKRAIIVNAPGGLRWTASFDGQTDAKRNPWGILPWSLVGRGAAPQWGFSRMLVQRPLMIDVTDWKGTVYPYLSSNNPAHFNLKRPVLTKNVQWKGALLPTFADIANETAVVRVTGNPGGPFNGDHASARHALCTGYPSGQTGLVAMFQHALKTQLGAAFAKFYPLPAVSVGEPAFSFGIERFASSLPIFLSDATSLPTTDRGSSAAAWANQVQAAMEQARGAARKVFIAPTAAEKESPKPASAAYVTELSNPALRLLLPRSPSSPALGTLVDGVTPVTNDMLSELFGISSAMTPRGDILFDAFGALASSTAPTWTADQNEFGLDGALAVRLLQAGAPVVSLAVGDFDTHSFEVVGPQAGYPHPVQIVQLARLLTGLEFALKNIADPQLPARSLWESTVVLVCSEFGRGGDNIGRNGFNASHGQINAGSDHDPACGWPVLGGPVAAGGRLIKDHANGGFFHQNRVFTTVLNGMGIENGNNPYLPYRTFPPIPGLLKQA